MDFKKKFKEKIDKFRVITISHCWECKKLGIIPSLYHRIFDKFKSKTKISEPKHEEIMLKPN